MLMMLEEPSVSSDLKFEGGAERAHAARVRAAKLSRRRRISQVDGLLWLAIGASGSAMVLSTTRRVGRVRQVGGMVEMMWTDSDDLPQG